MTVDDTLQTLRRIIGDTSLDSIYTDDDLIGYIEDAVNDLDIDVEMADGMYTTDIDGKLSYIIALKSAILIKIREKSTADRDNFLLKKGKLTIDNTNQSRDHSDTIDQLKKELKEKLFAYNSCSGIRLE